MSAEFDPLDVFFRDAAPADPPGDLAERILEAVGDPITRETLFWADVAQAARGALVASAAALLLSAGLVGMTVGDAADPSQTSDVDTAQAESSEALDLSSESLERQMASSFMLLGEDQ